MTYPTVYTIHIFRCIVMHDVWKWYFHTFNPKRKSENETIEMLPFTWFVLKYRYVWYCQWYTMWLYTIEFFREKNPEKLSSNLLKNKNWNTKKFPFCTWHFIFRSFQHIPHISQHFVIYTIKIKIIHGLKC